MYLPNDIWIGGPNLPLHLDNLPDMVQLRLDIQDLLHLLRSATDDDVGSTVVQDEDVGLWAVGGVQAAGERAAEDGRNVGDEPLGAVGGEDAHRVERFQACKETDTIRTYLDDVMITS